MPKRRSSRRRSLLLLLLLAVLLLAVLLWGARLLVELVYRRTMSSVCIWDPAGRPIVSLA